RVTRESTPGLIAVHAAPCRIVHHAAYKHHSMTATAVRMPKYRAGRGSRTARFTSRYVPIADTTAKNASVSEIAKRIASSHPSLMQASQRGLPASPGTRCCGLICFPSGQSL
ncbi:MAG: hypothetical protein ACRD3W_04505, partial [Terriglobales bacterium]